MAVLAFATLYAMVCGCLSGPSKGARLGVLAGIFMAGAHAATNFATPEISARLGLELVISTLIEWTLVGILVGFVSRPTGC